MFEPSRHIQSLINNVTTRTDAAATMQAVMDRAAEFSSPLEALLTGIALHPASRRAADEFLDSSWADEDYQDDLFTDFSLEAGEGVDEVIIGSGVHAAVYAAVRVLAGYPRPLVVERSNRAGGTFAMTTQPAFYLNSRNRAGRGGLAGDQGASLNYLPGAPIQAANLSMEEYQTNVDMAFVIRLTLAQFAMVVTNVAVFSVAGEDGATAVEFTKRPTVKAGRVIDARGLGDPVAARDVDGATVLTFPQFMSRMEELWPLRGVRRAAVVGGGDAGKGAVESLLGIAPRPPMAAAALDSVDRVDWYAENLPSTCEGWVQTMRGRYQAIGRYLRSDRFGRQRLAVVGRRAQPVALPDGALIGGRFYDLAIVCTGSQESPVIGLEYSKFAEYALPDGDTVARKHTALPVYRVGPHARLPLTAREIEDGIDDIPAKSMSIFRNAGKTAALAASLSIGD